MSEEPAENELDRLIIQAVESVNLENVQQLIDLVQTISRKSKQEILDRIMYLQQEERIRFKPPQTLKSGKELARYLGSTQALWYWFIVALTTVTAIVTFTVPEDAFPLTYLRYILGSILVFWLPGFLLVKTLFPQSGYTKTAEKNLDSIERVALSLGVSLALVPMVGLLLNYTPWGITLTSIILGLTALTLILATTAFIRENQVY